MHETVLITNFPRTQRYEDICGLAVYDFRMVNPILYFIAASNATTTRSHELERLYTQDVR